MHKVQSSVPRRLRALPRPWPRPWVLLGLVAVLAPALVLSACGAPVNASGPAVPYAVPERPGPGGTLVPLPTLGVVPQAESTLSATPPEAPTPGPSAVPSPTPPGTPPGGTPEPSQPGTPAPAPTLPQTTPTGASEFLTPALVTPGPAATMPGPTMTPIEALPSAAPAAATSAP
jgi:hypothetical protein